MFSAMSKGVFGAGKPSHGGSNNSEAGASLVMANRQRRSSTISGLSTLPETTEVTVECHVNVSNQCLDLVVRTNNARAFVHAVIALQGDSEKPKKKKKKKDKQSDSHAETSGGGGLFPKGKTTHVVHAMRAAGQALSLPLLPQGQRVSGYSGNRERERDAKLGYEKPVHTHTAALIRLQCLVSPRSAVVG